MGYHGFKPTLMILLVMFLAPTVYAWGPGECRKKGATAARCCEHEAYWCHGGNNGALAHCHFCQVECIKVPSISVCVWGGTSPRRHQKCHNGVEWFKVCTAIPNDQTLDGGAWDHVDRSLVSPSTNAPAESIELPVKLERPTRGTNTIENRAGGADKLSPSLKTRRSPVSNQIAFVIQVMTDVVNALRSAQISNTIEAVKNNMNRAVQAFDQLIAQATELAGMWPAADRSVARLAIDRFVSAVRVLKVTLREFIDDGATIEDLKNSVQTVLDELAMGFWTRAEAALNAYAAFNRFTPDWRPWFEAIQAYFQG